MRTPRLCPFKLTKLQVEIPVLVDLLVPVLLVPQKEKHISCHEHFEGAKKVLFIHLSSSNEDGHFFPSTTSKVTDA